MPRLAASSLTDLLSATRQSLSAPTWEKPTVSFLPAVGLVAAGEPEVSGAVADFCPQPVIQSRVELNKTDAKRVRVVFIVGETLSGEAGNGKFGISL